MDTNKDEAVKLAEEAVNEVAKKEQEDKIKEVSTKIEELLKESKMALYRFKVRGAHATVKEIARRQGARIVGSRGVFRPRGMGLQHTVRTYLLQSDTPPVMTAFHAAGIPVEMARKVERKFNA